MIQRYGLHFLLPKFFVKKEIRSMFDFFSGNLTCFSKRLRFWKHTEERESLKSANRTVRKIRPFLVQKHEQDQYFINIVHRSKTKAVFCFIVQLCTNFYLYRVRTIPSRFLVYWSEALILTVRFLVLVCELINVVN